MKTKNTTAQYRQGDVFIERIGLFPSKLKPVARKAGRLVLADGKSTGHSHAISTPRCALFQTVAEPGVLFLEVKASKADLVHDEHTTIALPKGLYRVIRQREYSADAVRRVED